MAPVEESSRHNANMARARFLTKYKNEIFFDGLHNGKLSGDSVFASGVRLKTGQRLECRFEYSAKLRIIYRNETLFYNYINETGFVMSGSFSKL